MLDVKILDGLSGDDIRSIIEIAISAYNNSGCTTYEQYEGCLVAAVDYYENCKKLDNNKEE